MLPEKRAKRAPKILTLLVLLLTSTLASGTSGCTRPTRTVIVRLPCVTLPPPEPPPVGADTRAMSWYRAALTAWAWGAWDACSPRPEP